MVPKRKKKKKRKENIIKQLVSYYLCRTCKKIYISPQHLVYIPYKAANIEGTRGEYFHEVNGQGCVFPVTRFEPPRASQPEAIMDSKRSSLKGKDW